MARGDEKDIASDLEIGSETYSRAIPKMPAIVSGVKSFLHIKGNVLQIEDQNDLIAGHDQNTCKVLTGA